MRCCVQVALLRALARIMAKLPHIPEMTLQQSLDIANQVSRSYPSLWPKQQLQVHTALCSLLAALAPKQALLIGILPRFVACLLTHTLRPSEATSSSQPGEITLHGKHELFGIAWNKCPG